MAGYTDTVNLQVNAIGNFSNVIGEVGKLQSRLQSLRLPKDLGSESAKGLAELQQKFQNLQNLANKGIKTKGDFNNFEKAAKEVDVALRQVEKSLNSISGKRIKLNMTDTDEIKKKIQELEQFKIEAAEIANLKSFGLQSTSGIFNASAIDKIKNSFKEGTAGAKNFQAVINGFKSNNIEQATTALKNFLNYAKQYEKTLNDSGQNTRGTDAVKWATEAMAAIGGADEKIKEFNADIKQMRADQFNKMASGADALKSQFTGVAASIRQSSKEMRNMAASSRDMHSQLGMLQTQANYFFGLQNMFQLFKRNIQGTFDTVKQLDAAMTETAVVTDFSVSDMWSKLPLYTKTANQLGATIKGAYETMTLYYQQGLNTEEAFAVGTETMKMARIAGLDYAQTTNMMTAALRGFNMEINTTSAQRINDVYSELAAITASDTRELGEAMERTASIAHSAGMDFGNTTAFLAQMIETTREAPENLGTAMKTIVARFQELKQNPYQISEVEGEEVDFNRVDKALKTIGVDLMDNRDKFRDLDDVFMDISEKWDGLSQTQQRYIATIAAGSRQQSRFLAMVGNYDRLKQLTEAAANSEGAADVQFAKTLDSMESKINRLKNAWDQFAMGIANNKLLKGAVDFGVKLLDTVNKIENKIQDAAGGFDSLGGSIAKSITSITALWAAFKVGGKLVDTSIGLLGGFLGVTKVKGAGLFSGISGQRSAAGTAQAAAIYSPIVNAINNAAAKITNSEQSLGQLIKANGASNKSFQDFRASQRGLRFEQREARLGEKDAFGRNKYTKTSKSFTGLNAAEYLKGFSEEQQRALLLQVPGTRKALERSYLQATKNLNLSDTSTNVVNQLRSQISKEIMKPGGAISPEAGMRLLGDPRQLAKLVGDEAVRNEILDNYRKNSQRLLDEAKIKYKDKTGADRFRAIKAYMRQGKEQLYNPTVQLSKEELRANSFSGITSGATAAGQAVMNLGLALDNLGLHGIGSILTSMGSTMTSFGLAASSAVEGVSALNKVLSTVGLSAGPVAIGLTAITAAIGVAIYAAKKEREEISKIQKAGRKVTEDYDNTIEQTTKNINKLNDEVATFSELSLGVDSNGNNINLGTEEYSDYLKIVNEVAKMHPELVKGYNAHGQAILKNNNAVREAITLERKQQKEAEADFTSTESLDKLIASRDTTKRWKVGQAQIKTSTAGHGIVHTKDASKLEKDSQSVIDNIKKLDNGKEILSQLESDFQLTTGALTNLTDEGIRAIQEHGDVMLSTVQGEYASATDKTTKGLVENIQNSIAQVGTDTKGIEAVTEPIYRALSTYASRQGLFDNIPEEFREAAETGIKEISKLSINEETGAKISGADMQARVRAITQAVENLNGHSDEYQQALSEMDKAQKQFGKDLDKEAYGDAISSNIGALMKWRDQALDIYKSTGQESQKIIAETLQNQIEAYDTFATNGGATLADGFNQHIAELEKAANAYENFQSQTENINDYYTGSDNMKQIIDDIKDGVDDLGKGSQTFWKGAEALLGEDYIKGKSFDTVNKQVGALKNIFYDSEGEVRDAEAQVGKFFDYLQQRQDDSVEGKGLSGTIADYMKVADGKFDFDKMANLSAEQFKDVANSLGMSETSLISLLNQARQFANIKFSNLDVLREGLATMDGTIAGNKTNKAGENSLYTRRSTFEAEAEAQGYTLNEIDDLAKEIKSKNVKLLADADEMGIKQLTSTVKDMGIKSGQEFIQNFSELGYGRGEIQTLYDKFMGSDKIGQELKDKIDLKDTTFGDAYDEALKSLELEFDQDANESTADNTAQIVSIASSILAAVGGLQADDFDKNSTIEGANGHIYYEGKGYDALNKVYGGTGVDTMAQFFAKGQNKNGKELNSTQYEDYYNKLLQMRQDYDSKAAELEIASQNASSEAEATRFARQAEYYRQASLGLDNYIKKGEEAHQKYLSNNEEEVESDNNKTRNKQKNNDDEAFSTEQRTEREKQAKNLAWSEKKDETGTSTEQEDINGLIKSYQALGVAMASGTEQIKQLDSANPKIDFQTDTSKIKEANEEVNKSTKEPKKVKYEAQLAELEKANEEADKPAKKPKKIKYEAQLTELEKADEKANEPTKKPKKIKYEAELTKVNQVQEKGKQQIQKEEKDSGKQSSTVTNNITLDSKISNPNEPKKKIDKAMPKNYKKRIHAAITMDASVKTGNLSKQLSSATNKASKGLKIKAGTTSTITAKTSGQGEVDSLRNAIKKIPRNTSASVKASVSGLSQVNSLASAIRNLPTYKSVTVNYKKTGDPPPSTGGLISNAGVLYRARGGLASNPMFKRQGTDTIPTMLTPGEYVENRKAVRYFGIDFMRQINHKNLLGALQSFGSTAKGSRRGRVGPNNNGGLTLTGEEGFEVAWLPSENKSMILGIDGPQMVDLPKDAVVWDNEQSKKILKQKSISTPSFARGHGDIPGGSSGGRNTGGGNRSGGGSNGSRSGGSGGDGGKQAKKNQKKHIKILDKAGKIATWWWNMTKKVEATQRAIDKLTKEGEKVLKEIGTTLASAGEKFGNKLIEKLNLQIDLNTEMQDKAEEKLTEIDTKKTRKKTKNRQKKVDKDEKKLLRARETKSKKDDKKARKRLKKDTKKLRKTQKGANWANISYEAIERTKQGKKVKKKKVTKKDRINLSKYVYLDPETGAYVVDRDAIKRDFGKTKKGQAVRDAAQKRLDNYVGKRDTAEDNVDKAKDALNELGQQLYETFFAWENELTKIWNVTQKIADAESKRGRAESFSELLDAQVADGTISSKNNLLGQDYFNKINTAFTKGINEQISSINLTRESINLKKTNLKDLLNGETEKKTLENINDIIDYNSAYGEWKDLAADTEKAIGNIDNKIDNAKKDRNKAQREIKQANKVINNKKSSKKDKKEAKQDKKEAKKDKDKAVNNIELYTGLRETFNDTLTAANQEMQNILDAGYKELNDTELLAYQTEQTNLEDQLKIIQAANEYMRPQIKDDGTISVNFNTELFEQHKQEGLLNSTTAEKIQDYVKKIVDQTQDLHDTYKDLTEKITELHSTLADLQDAWVGYSEDLMSYLEDAQEVDIEKYKSLSDSIRDALEKLLDQVKKNLEERRRQEDNAKTERDISQKQQRLAALRADTSGGHQVEIAQLEKEIADAQTDYGRNLEDQLLDRLNDQADAAAEQRERIIELEEAINSAVNNAETVNKWMENPGQFKEEIRAAVYKAKDYQNLTKAQQEQVDRQTDQLLVGLETNPKKTEEVKNAINQMTALVEFLEGSLSDVGDNVEANKNNTDSIDDKVATVIEGLRGNIDAVTTAVKDVDQTLKDNETAEVGRQTRAEEAAKATNDASNQSAYKLAIANAQSNGTITANQFNKAINAGANINKSADQVVQDLKTSQLTWKEILTAAHSAGWGPKKIKDLNRNASKDSAFRKAWESIFPNKKWNEYAIGGLANYTGPAWLDGTPSKPELVLNSTDTKNFIALRDVLSKAMGNIDNSSETLTNTSYEININVDHINNDYDVDKIAARIKKDIVKDAGYRNVTQVRNLR